MLYFAIFAAFKESVTLNLAQWSFKVKVIHTIGYNRKMYDNLTHTSSSTTLLHLINTAKVIKVILLTAI